MKSLRNRVVVITGAGSGIGQALAIACAGEGARVAISDIDQAGLAATLHAIKDRGGVATARRLDVADRDAVYAYADEVVADYGVVHLLVNNAGVSLTGDLVDLDDADLEWIVGVNFWGVVHGSRAFLPHLIASGDGHLVTISSLFGLVSIPGQSAYNATKFAVRGLTEAIREEMLVAGHPVGVTVVHPGGVKTGIVRNGRASSQIDLAQVAAEFDVELARTTADRAAATILRAVRRNQPRVLVGVDAHAVHQFARIIGARYQDVVAGVVRRRARRS